MTNKPITRRPVLARLGMLPNPLDMQGTYSVLMERKNGGEYWLTMTGADLLSFKGHVQEFPIQVVRL